LILQGHAQPLLAVVNPALGGKYLHADQVPHAQLVIGMKAHRNTGWEAANCRLDGRGCVCGKSVPIEEQQAQQQQPSEDTTHVSIIARVAVHFQPEGQGYATMKEKRLYISKLQARINTEIMVPAQALGINYFPNGLISYK
jgi:hypothetical protein